MEDNSKGGNSSIQSFSDILPREQEGQQNMSQQSILKLFPNPVHIISPDFKAKHLKKLVQQIQKLKIPLQFQHETETLGYDLTKNPNKFFVVVDNKIGKINLGEQFNLDCMTIVGYPKIGRNQNNIYCEQPSEVIEAYKQFIAFKSQKPFKANNYFDGSNLSISQNAFKTLKSQNSHIKLKCFSKLNNQTSRINQKFDEQYKIKSKDSLLQRNLLQKRQTNSILIIFSPQKNSNDHDVQTSITQQNQYKKMLAKISTNLIDSNTLLVQRNSYQFSSFGDLVSKVTDLKRKQKSKTNYYVLTQSKNLDLMLKINQNSHLINQVKLIVCFFAHNHDNKNPSYYQEDQNKKIQITKKCNKLKNFHSLVFTQNQCYKTLKTCGFCIENKQNLKSVQKKKLLQSQRINVDSLSKKKIQSKHKIIHNNSKSNLKSIKKLNFLQQSKPLVNEQQKKTKQLALSDQKPIIQSKLQSKSKFIRPISSLLSQRSQKSSLSSSISSKKFKIIKFNKQKSKIKQEKHISQVNSEYCNQVMNKILSKKKLSNKSLLNNIVLVPQQKKSIDKVQVLQNQNTLSQSRKTSKSIRSQKTTYRKLKLFQNNTPQSLILTQSCQSFSNLQSNVPQFLVNQSIKPKIKSPQTPIFKDAGQYYFGTEYSFKDSNTNQKMHAIDGMLYIQHNDLICSLINKFKQKCPISLIPRKQYRPFYFAREYSQQLKKLWKQKKSRQCLSLLIDLQGFKEIIKYYSNVFYQDDELQYYSSIEDSNKKQHEYLLQQKFAQTAKSSQFLKIICFVLIQNEQDYENELFQKINSLMHKLPIFKIHKLFNKKSQIEQISKQQQNKSLDFLYENIYRRIMTESKIQNQNCGFGLVQTS